MMCYNNMCVHLLCRIAELEKEVARLRNIEIAALVLSESMTDMWSSFTEGEMWDAPAKEVKALRSALESVK